MKQRLIRLHSGIRENVEKLSQSLDLSLEILIDINSLDIGCKGGRRKLGCFYGGKHEVLVLP